MDGKDARWLCMLLMHGLVRASFMPTAEQRGFARLLQKQVVLFPSAEQGTESPMEDIGEQ